MADKNYLEFGGRYFDKNKNDLSDMRHEEKCDESRGYANACQDEYGKPSRCRLCATCMKGYKRKSSSAQCQRCPPKEMNRFLLALGFFIMMLGSAFMVYIAIASESSDQETSDAIKKIIVSRLQFINCISEQHLAAMLLEPR